MRIEKYIHQAYPNLILCMAGWSVTPELFHHLRVPPETDVWIVYVYRSATFDEDLSRYATVHLVAWSLGVWEAQRLWAGKRLFTTATAINGTPCPLHDRYGIPVLIFEGTLARIDAEGMRRFNRRMCGDRETLSLYMRLPARPLEEIRDELRSLYERIRLFSNEPSRPEDSSFWSRAILSTNDQIFPINNLRRYWRGRCPIQEIEAAHLPFYHYQTWQELWR